MNSKRLHILVVDPLDEIALLKLREKFVVTLKLKPTDEELKTLIADANIIILRSSVKLDESVLEIAKNLKIIARAGSGVDNIDIEAAKKRGIIVFKVPAVSARSVAELGFGLILSVARNIALADSSLREGKWKKNELSGIELQGKTIGIVGLGNIGTEVANLAQGFGMHVMACVANHNEEREKRLSNKGIKLALLQNLLEHADIVLLALPLQKSTANLIAIEQFKIMKRTAILVNVARAGIVNTNDLISALENGIIKGAATDVLNEETGNTPFGSLKNIVMTPHIGAMTEDAQLRIGQKILDGIQLALEGQDVPNRLC